MTTGSAGAGGSGLAPAPALTSATPAVGETVEGVVVAWDQIVEADPRVGAAADAPVVSAAIDALCAAGAHVVVVTVGSAEDVDRWLGARRPPTDRFHVCDAPERAARWLTARGITGSLVLAVGDGLGVALPRARVAPVSGRSGNLVALLREQLARRAEQRMPWIDEDPDWVVPLPTDVVEGRAAEALGTLANGWAAVRGAREEDGPGSAPLMLVSGIYTTDAAAGLLPAPPWTHLDITGGQPDRRLLDLRTGMLAREATGAAALRTVRFVSAARPYVGALRAEGDAQHLGTDDAFDVPVAGGQVEHARRGELRLARTTGPGGGGICVAARDRTALVGDRRRVDRVAVWAAEQGKVPAWHEPAARLAATDGLAVDGLDVDALAAEHRAAWARRWADASVVVEGDPDLQLAIRFAMFHLLAAAPDRGEAAVGARGLTGPAYGGHVFWDADVFVLPALAAIHPAGARAMLQYRIRRLPAARAAAQAQGLEGARFPWESARDGDDVTPTHVHDRLGRVLRVQTAQEEEHIVADIAWAASEYVAWTGDDLFLTGPGRDLVVEPARYWASRVRVDRAGRGHIDHVMGPDEYHPVVDDNAFTNVMARWSLRRAAQLVDELDEAGSATRVEAEAWRRLADRLVDGWDPERGLHEQFAGYWELEPLLVAAVAEPPVAADVLLGSRRLQGSQLIKQADVLMLHHLVPRELPPGSLAQDLAFYDPRTAHGSSLSPAIHAALFARAGQPDRALELLRIAARLDLDDITSTTAGGLHLATMGGVWQALAYGFLGLRLEGDVLGIEPCLPAGWDALELRFRWQGQRMTVRADHRGVTVGCTEPVAVRIAGGAREVCSPPEQRFAVEGSTS